MHTHAHAHIQHNTHTHTHIHTHAYTCTHTIHTHTHTHTYIHMQHTHTHKHTHTHSHTHTHTQNTTHHNRTCWTGSLIFFSYLLLKILFIAFHFSYPPIILKSGFPSIEAFYVPQAYTLRRFYQYFDHFLGLRMWKMQLLDEKHLLIKYASEDVVTLQIQDPNSQPSFFMVYNMETTQVLGVYENTSEELAYLFETFCDMFRNASLYYEVGFWGSWEGWGRECSSLVKGSKLLLK